jgi:hypothetical protein
MLKNKIQILTISALFILMGCCDNFKTSNAVYIYCVKNDSVFNYLSAQIRKDSLNYQRIIKAKNDMPEIENIIYPENEIKNIMLKFKIYEINWQSYGVAFRLSPFSNNTCYNSWYKILNEPHNLKDTTTYKSRIKVNGPYRYFYAEAYW